MNVHGDSVHEAIDKRQQIASSRERRRARKVTKSPYVLPLFYERMVDGKGRKFKTIFPRVWENS